jgi:hypothetical protein
MSFIFGYFQQRKYFDVLTYPIKSLQFEAG